MQEITEQLEAELGHPPPATFDITATVTIGRKLVRRRRVAAGGVMLALVLVVGGAGWAVTSQFSSHDPSLQVAAVPGVSTAGLIRTTDLTDDFPVGHDPRTDQILVKDGWEVIQRIEDPVTGRYAEQSPFAVIDSVGLALRKNDTTMWAVLYRFPPLDEGNGGSSSDGGAVADTRAASGIADLAGWLQERMSHDFTLEAAQ